MFKNSVATSLFLIVSSAIILYAMINMNILNVQQKINSLSVIENIFMIGTGFFVVFFPLLIIHSLIKKMKI